jgi:V/A-type H+-transporting ATPase subunit E
MLLVLKFNTFKGVFILLNEIEKTNNFLNAINKYAEEQRNKIRDEGRNFKEEELEKAEKEALKEAYLLIQREMATIRSDIASKISKEEILSRKKVFEKKEEIRRKAFDSAKEKLLNFTNTKNYKELLLSLIRNILNLVPKFSETILLICERDKKFIPDIKLIFKKKHSINIDKEIKIGGVKAYNDETKMLIDETLDSKLEKEKKWFGDNFLYGD